MRLPGNDTLIERWRLSMLAGAYREHTIYRYAHALEHWRLVIGPERHLARVDRDDALRFLAWCREQRWKPATIRSEINGIRAFYRWLAGETGFKGRIVDPFLGVRIPPVRSEPGPWLSEDQMQRLLDVQHVDLRGIRDKAMFLFMAATACRPVSIQRLNVEDIYWDRQAAMVTGKAEKKSIKALWPITLHALRRYMSTTRVLWARDGENAVFVGRQGQRINHVAIGDALKRLARDAGLEERITAYWIRRGVTHWMRAAGADVRSIQTMLDHEKLSTTSLYMAGHDPKIWQEHAQYHPLARVQVKGAMRW